ncbi:type III secretion system outer membrane ring subunit SctC [Pseudomonas mucidolens]|uniref:Type III secretion protein C n=1 Tax=Pseudomonas mucidolens TaxID=46679 RepID=A0A1H2N5N5_9PSED|nr:type III secretion system outer membrane ring subunit SctC [Pseudomonas mucidolens]SDV00471.1 type III secretion protein C [Pseudomonas mucidolens]SQH32629.1 secretory protein [Pseudomonas mucidolens]
MLGSAACLAEAYQAQDENLRVFFTALSAPMGQSIVVSQKAARKRITGHFDFLVPQAVLDTVTLAQRLIWYSDGQALYIYDASEAKSSVVSLRHISVDKLRDAMRRSGLSETRHPLREGTGRIFYISGPPNYVDHVLRLAQLVDRKRPELRMGPQEIGVVQVLNTHVADRQYAMAGEKIVVPGMATMLEKLLATERKNVAPLTQGQSGLLAGGRISVMAYPDTNSLLIKGNPAQVSFIERLVAELDVPKRSVEISLWRVDMDRHAFEKMGVVPAGRHKKGGSQLVSRVLTPLEDRALMTRIRTLERRRQAAVVTLPVILTQENVPAMFHDEQSLYLASHNQGGQVWLPVGYGTQVSVLPRLAEANEIEMQLTIEDGRQINPVGNGERSSAAVGRVGINTVVRVAQGKRLLLGSFRRDVEGAKPGPSRERYDAPGTHGVRLFIIQARAVNDDLTPRHVPGPRSTMTPAQHAQARQAFMNSSAQ